MITSGSGLERFMHCIGSSVYPRALDAGTEYSERGKELHSYLQRITEGMTIAESLALVDDRFREDATWIDVDALRDVLGLTAEMTFAYNPVFDTARVLGVGLDREYVAAGLTEDEIPVTMDIVGLDNPETPTRGRVVDYKFGWTKLTPAARNWQMIGGALCLQRVYDLDEVGVQLIHMRGKFGAKRDLAVFTAADVAVAAAAARARWDEVLHARERYEKTKIEPEVMKGTWCKHCPSYHACGAQMSLVRAAVNRDEYEHWLRDGAVENDLLARAWLFLEEMEEPRKRLKGQVLAAAKERPVLIRTFEDGTEEWLGVCEKVGNLQLNAEIARDVVREMLGEDQVDKVCTYEVTQGRLEIACKAVVAKGQGAAKLRAVLSEIKKRGGAHKPVKHDVGLYKIRPHQIAAKAG